MLKVLESWIQFFKALDNLKVVNYADYNIWSNRSRKRVKQMSLEAGIDIDVGKTRKPTFEDCKYDN